MSRAKWFAVRKPSMGEIIATSANQIVPPKFWGPTKNVALYSPDPSFLLQCWREIWGRDYLVSGRWSRTRDGDVSIDSNVVAFFSFLKQLLARFLHYRGATRPCCCTYDIHIALRVVVLGLRLPQWYGKWIFGDLCCWHPSYSSGLWYWYVSLTCTDGPNLSALCD